MALSPGVRGCTFRIAAQSPGRARYGRFAPCRPAWSPSMDLTVPLTLARLQFAFTVTFHFLFPAFTIGLASYLAVLEGLWLWIGKDKYLDLFRYWLKVFAVNFAMGVVSGIVLSYQFGTNWAAWADRVGPVLGPLMAYEVLTAFFLEA